MIDKFGICIVHTKATKFYQAHQGKYACMYYLMTKQNDGGDTR